MESETNLLDATCPGCGTPGMNRFYDVSGVPVHSVLLMFTRDEALTYPRRDISLGFCEVCGFISNIAFDPTVHEYSTKYEETQGFSPTFNSFHRTLAQRLIDKYDLHDKDIIEIGCGKGEFLMLLCEMGNNRGVGFDPAYVSERNTSESRDRVKFIQDFYSEKYTDYHGDFVCCKMTLEHIPDTKAFVSTVRRSIGDRFNTTVFFQIPDMTRILRDVAFWDIYYEHCSYFTKGSLARLFRACGFDVLDIGTEYDDQYLMIEARPGTGRGTPVLAEENDLEQTRADVADFAGRINGRFSYWRQTLQGIVDRGESAVLWGGGSKGVAFLTTLGITNEIQYAVDINPYKHGTFMAGTGHEIVSPDFLQSHPPHVVIVMNPIYCDEIGKDLARMGITAKLLPIG
jgi:SAM-dependent methyltransferase